MITLPTHAGAFLVAVVWPRSELTKVRGDLWEHFRDEVEVTDPAVADLLRGSDLLERLVGTGHLPAFFRIPQGQGWALVGDAGLHKDPLPAYGICDAWKQAESFAHHIALALDGNGEFHQYGKERDAQVIAPYEATYRMAGMDFPAPVMERLAREQRSADGFSIRGLLQVLMSEPGPA